MHGRRITVALAILALVPTGAAAAVAPPDKCEAKKLTATGTYALCRLKAEAKAARKGTAADYTACDAGLGKKFDKAEDKAGPGVCPSEGDQAVIADAVAECAAELTDLLAGSDAGCPPGHAARTPTQVVDDLRAAIAAADWAAVACNYHAEAFVIDDQGVLVGPGEIVAALMSLHDLSDGAVATVTENLPFRDTVRVLFTLDAGWFAIEDGVHTYVVRNGRIQRQTSHGLITFTGPPP